MIFTIKRGQNPDYKYTIVKTKHDVFDKFEFNNKLRQAIISHFDTTGKLKWLQYIEYDNKGNRIYDETFNKTYINPVFRKIEYAYNEYDDMTELKTVFPKVIQKNYMNSAIREEIASITGSKEKHLKKIKFSWLLKE